VATFLAWESFSNGWWGDGEMMFYIDGERKEIRPSRHRIRGYFGGHGGFGDTSAHVRSGLSAA
jgi:hypothetical protein